MIPIETQNVIPIVWMSNCQPRPSKAHLIRLSNPAFSSSHTNRSEASGTAPRGYSFGSSTLPSSLPSNISSARRAVARRGGGYVNKPSIRSKYLFFSSSDGGRCDSSGSRGTFGTIVNSTLEAEGRDLKSLYLVRPRKKGKEENYLRAKILRSVYRIS